MKETNTKELLSMVLDKVGAMEEQFKGFTKGISNPIPTGEPAVEYNPDIPLMRSQSNQLIPVITGPVHEVMIQERESAAYNKGLYHGLALGAVLGLTVILRMLR